MLIERAAAHQRTTRTLMASVIPTTAAMASSFSAAAVLGKEITGSETLAGLAVASMQVGSVFTTVPLARRMARLGRRRGMVAGWSIGAVGASLAFIAAVADFYPLLVVGILGVGAGNATNFAARFAAADLAPEDRRARAIGMLVWAATVGAALGPTIALGPAADVARYAGLPELSGPYLLGLVLFIIGLTATQLWLRPDPLEVLGTIGADTVRPASPLVVGRRIATVPAARLAVIAMLTGQAVMVGVMTMTPLHMENGDHQLRVIGWVISVHVIGMYAFSPHRGLARRPNRAPSGHRDGRGDLVHRGRDGGSHQRTRQPGHVRRLDAGGLGLEFRADRGERDAHRRLPGCPTGGGSRGCRFHNDHQRGGGRAGCRGSGGGSGLSPAEPLGRA